MDKIHISLSAETVGHIGSLPITNTLLMSLVATVLLCVLAFVSFRKVSLIPSRFQSSLELIVGGIYDYIIDVLGNEKLARRFFPLIATFFFFILASNLIQFIPGVGSIGFTEMENGHKTFAPLLRSANTDLNVTLVLALFAFFAIEFAGLKELGLLSYLSKFVNIRSFLGFLIGIIDLFSEVARLLSFSFRLFGNILAGEVVIMIIIFFVPVVLPVPMMLFEVFVAVIQAAIFALLTLYFIKIAVTEHH